MSSRDDRYAFALAFLAIARGLGARAEILEALARHLENRSDHGVKFEERLSVVLDLELADEIDLPRDAAALVAREEAPPAAAIPFAPDGLLVGRYRVLQRIGRGGMGVVHEAEDEQLHRRVAVKVLRSPDDAEEEDDSDLVDPVAILASDPVGREQRFLREALITADLDHPGIVPVYEMGETEDGSPFYVMRYVPDGQNLLDKIPVAGRADLAERLALLEPFLKVCDTVGYAHDHGVIHRDLKPSNIGLGAFGEVLVLDWGIAKRVDAAVDEPEPVAERDLSPGLSLLTGPGAMGTLGYLSPEAARGDVGAIDVQSDVYGLGATLFHILTGKTLGVAVRAGETRPPNPRALNPGLPRRLDEICQRALAPDKAARTPTASALAGEIRDWQREENEARERRKHRAWARSALIALLLASLGVAVFVAHRFNVERRRVLGAERTMALAQDEGVSLLHLLLEDPEDVLHPLSGPRLTLDAATKALAYCEALPVGEGTPEVSRIKRRCRLLLGDAALDEGRFELAREVFHALASEPESAGGEPGDTLGISLHLGRALAGEGRMAEARACFVAVRTPSDLDALSADARTRGLVLRVEADLELAELACALEDWPACSASLDKATETLDRLEEEGATRQVGVLRLRHHRLKGYVLLESEQDAALALAEGQAGLAVAARSPGFASIDRTWVREEANLRCLKGRALLALGRPEAALERVAPAVQTLDRWHASWKRSFAGRRDAAAAWVALSEVREALGQEPAARIAVDRAIALLDAKEGGARPPPRTALALGGYFLRKARLTGANIDFRRHALERAIAYLEQARDQGLLPERWQRRLAEAHFAAARASAFLLHGAAALEHAEAAAELYADLVEARPDVRDRLDEVGHFVEALREAEDKEE